MVQEHGRVQLVIRADGTVVAVHDDALADALCRLGRLEVRRASTVEFDNEVQGWMVEVTAYRNSDGQPIIVGPFGDRAWALAWERAYLEARLAGADDASACRVAAQVMD